MKGEGYKEVGWMEKRMETETHIYLKLETFKTISVVFKLCGTEPSWLTDEAFQHFTPSMDGIHRRNCKDYQKWKKEVIGVEK